MIQIEKDGETRNCHKHELARMQRQGWEAQEETNPEPDGKQEVILYKRLKGELPEGYEIPEEGMKVIIESECFPNELLDDAIEDGWFKTKEEAENAPPDKTMEPAGSGAVTLEA